MESIQVTEIRVCAIAGSGLWDCRKEAAILALKENQTVRLIHNDVEYVADPVRLVESVCKPFVAF
jgi:hypothetical protein